MRLCGVKEWASDPANDQHCPPHHSSHLSLQQERGWQTSRYTLPEQLPHSRALWRWSPQHPVMRVVNELNWQSQPGQTSLNSLSQCVVVNFMVNRSALERSARAKTYALLESTIMIPGATWWGVQLWPRSQAAPAKPGACVPKFHPTPSTCIYPSLRPRCLSCFPPLDPWSPASREVKCCSPFFLSWVHSSVATGRQTELQM